MISTSAPNASPTASLASSSVATVSVRPNTKKQRQYKPRKSTYIVRKEETRSLRRASQELTARINALRSVRPVVDALLQQRVSEQELLLARAQGALTGHAVASRNAGCGSIPSSIYLSRDLEARQQQLQVIRSPRLHAGRRFLVERGRELDRSKAYSSCERFETAEGDYCILRFEVTPLRDLEFSRAGARRTFRTMLQSMRNAELVISATSDFVTIREDGDAWRDDVTLHRLLSSSSRGDVLVESQSVSFSEFVGRSTGEGEEYGILTTDVVAKDELFPYHPKERVRRDVSAILMVEAVPQDGSADGDDADNLVVLTRWSSCTFVRSELSQKLSAEKATKIYESFTGWGTAMVDDMHQILQQDR
ncbi:hypothetical protein BBJ28_00013727 [Nothophytophthora sp. Chile5]|nr:hypothetical protein BBJ28_00013727 [Nothophytophthora sp. Chile5]